VDENGCDDDDDDTAADSDNANDGHNDQQQTVKQDVRRVHGLQRKINEPGRATLIQDHILSLKFANTHICPTSTFEPK